MRIHLLGVGLLSALAFGSIPAFAASEDGSIAAAEDQDQIRDQDRDQLQTPDQDQLQDKEQLQIRDQQVQKDMDQLHKHLRRDLKIGQSALATYDPELRRYFQLNGDENHLRNTFRYGWEQGCQGECLRTMVHSMNRAMVFGVQDSEAAQMVQTALQQQIRERDRLHAGWTETELGDRVRDQVRDRLRTWQHDQERLMDQEMLRDRDREQIREQQRDMDPMGPGTPQQDRQGGGR